jgi:hypothetical protein
MMCGAYDDFIFDSGCCGGFKGGSYRPSRPRKLEQSLDEQWVAGRACFFPVFLAAELAIKQLQTRAVAFLSSAVKHQSAS